MSHKEQTTPETIALKRAVVKTAVGFKSILLVLHFHPRSNVVKITNGCLTPTEAYFCINQRKREAKLIVEIKTYINDILIFS